MSTTGVDPARNPNAMNNDSGRGAPALGGAGDRENASVGAARGSAHSGTTDETHTNALNQQKERTPSPSPGGKK